MKYQIIRTEFQKLQVTPFVGVWIEIKKIPNDNQFTVVTPFVGVWIEIIMIQWIEYDDVSLPSWECGLKFNGDPFSISFASVTPFVGVWIEIS